jgi:hypothetical protein
MPVSPNLNKDETQQSGTLKMRKYLDGRLETLRKKNDDAMHPDARAVLVGEIAAVKALLKFIDTRPLVVPDETQFHD